MGAKFVRIKTSAIMDRVMTGHKIKSIAAEFGVDQTVIHRRIENLRAEYGASNTNQLIALIATHGYSTVEREREDEVAHFDTCPA